MISARTFESWRVYTLDTVHRLSEAAEFAEEIVSGKKIDKAAFVPVMDELIWSMNSDPVVQRIAKDEFRELARQNITNQNIFERRKTVEFLYAHLSVVYKNELETSILNFIESGNLHGIRKAGGYYLSYLLNSGYSRDRIDDCIESSFFSGRVARTGAGIVKKFFSNFTKVPERYEVAIGLSRDFGIFLEGLGYTVEQLSSAGKKIRECVESNKNSSDLRDFVVLEQVALDEHAAVSLANQEMSALRAYAYLGPSGMHADWGSVCRVKSRSNRSGRDLEPPKPSLFKLFDPNGPATGRANRARAQAQVVKSINRNFDEESAGRINSALTTATLALSSGRPESQMISLWSAIEVLLSDPFDGPRIVHYTSNLVPAVCMYHARRQFLATNNDLKVMFRSRYTDIVEEVREISSTYKPGSSLAACLFLEEYAEERRKLLDLCDAQPIARHRVDRLLGNYQNLECTLKTISDHEMRVSWQANRIYRSRNLLVHAGTAPSYINQLIQNADEYFRFLVIAVLQEAFGWETASVDRMVHAIKTKYNVKIQKFKLMNAKGRHDLDSLKLLLSI